MSLLSPVDKEIAELFKEKLLKKFVVDKLDDEEDEPELPTKEEDQSADEWRLAAIKALGEQSLNDPLFNIKGKAKQEKAESLKGQVLVEGATYYVFPGEMSAETAAAFSKDFGRPLSPKAVNNSIRYLIKKKHTDAAKQLAKNVAAQVNRSNPGVGNQRGNWGKGRGRGGFGGRSYRGNSGGWNHGGYPVGPWRPGVL